MIMKSSRHANVFGCGKALEPRNSKLIVNLNINLVCLIPTYVHTKMHDYLFNSRMSLNKFCHVLESQSAECEKSKEFLMFGKFYVFKMNLA